MKEKLNILFAVSEADPFVKTGGLADVAGSLPTEIKKMGHDVRVVLPEYSQIPNIYIDKTEHLIHFRTKIGWRNEYVGVNCLEQDGVLTYFIDNKKYFHRPWLYENNDRHIQFIYFCRALLEMLPRLDFKPDIIHLNDWQTAPITLLLDDNYRQYDFYRNIYTLFTVHNLRYQGQFSPEILDDALGVNYWHWDGGNIRHNGQINFMKTGLMYADKINTVSPTYAEEIKTPYYGECLDYVMRMRARDLSGILNGISYNKFDPENDEFIYEKYEVGNIEGKKANKKGLQLELGLPVKDDIPLIGIVTRLVEQKGLDLIIEIFSQLMENEVQFVLLGTGEKRYEEFFREMNRLYSDQTAVMIRYDAQMAQRIYAGSDLFLMPSRFEPCGLGQMIAMRYGTIPLVMETGGLKDTVIPYNEFTDSGYGFSFSNYKGRDMLYTVKRALEFYQQPVIWNKLVKRVSEQDFSWRNSASKYIKLYKSILNK